MCCECIIICYWSGKESSFCCDYFFFPWKKISYQIPVSTDTVSVLEGLQLYRASHGHLTSDSCECFFVNADIALWLSSWKNSKTHSQALLPALWAHSRRRWSETSWTAKVDRSFYCFPTLTYFSMVINRWSVIAHDDSNIYECSIFGDS